MTELKRRVKAAGRRLGLDDRDEVIVVHPPKFANETDDEYKARLAASDALPRDPIQADNVTIIPPAKSPIE